MGLGASSPLHQVLMETSMTEMRMPAVTRPKMASNPLKGIGQPEEITVVFLGSRRR